MKQAYVYRDEKSQKFWWIGIEDTENEFVVNFGKLGTSGKYQIKEFDNADECKKQSEKLIQSKIKKGYILDQNFDYIHHFYFDDEEYGLSPMTSHPHFNKYFDEENYLNCADDEQPFGNDAGSDAFQELQGFIRKNGDGNLLYFINKFLANWWGDFPFPLQENMQKEFLEQQFELNENYSRMIHDVDNVILATALGQIKITGFIDNELKSLALLALQRIQNMGQAKGWGYSSMNENMQKALQKFDYLKSDNKETK